jgi:PadR family transcriptional regulator, regulatory protein PadR
MTLSTYEHTLLNGWEEVFKKSQLTLWIMLALKEGPKHMAAIKEFVLKLTNGTLEADDQSMYRALRRYAEAELVVFSNEPGDSGPDRKVYNLTASGSKVLDAFLERNIRSVFYKPNVIKLIERREK